MSTTNGTTAHPETATPDIYAQHPAFCEGGIRCEKVATSQKVADWIHEGHETTWHAGDTQFRLALVRRDGHARGQYQRAPVEVEMLVRETGVEGEDHEWIEVLVELDEDRLSLLIGFLIHYRDQLQQHGGIDYDMPTESLPRQGGNTKAQEVWNAIGLGRDLGRFEAERAAQ